MNSLEHAHLSVSLSFSLLLSLGFFRFSFTPCFFLFWHFLISTAANHPACSVCFKNVLINVARKCMCLYVLILYSVVEVLEKHGLQKPISYVKNSQNSEEEAHQLMVKLCRHTGRKYGNAHILCACIRTKCPSRSHEHTVHLHFCVFLETLQ